MGKYHADGRARYFHLKLGVKQTLLNWSDEKFRGVFQDDEGHELGPFEARSALLDELVKGHLFIPVGGPCEGFDHAGGGCPGHLVKEETDET